MLNRELKRCKRCALPETYPGVQFNKSNVCNYCVYFDVFKQTRDKDRSQLKEEVIKIINEVKLKKAKYDCIVAYSGGKDSSFLLYILKKKFKLKILAHTLDHGYMSTCALKNIKKVTGALDISHRFFRPPKDVIRKIFSAALINQTTYPKEILALMSPLCTACQGMILGTAIKLAQKENIPLLFTGFTPGQSSDIGLENFLKSKSNIYFSYVVYKDDPLDLPKIIKDPIDELCGDEIENLYFKSQYLGKGENVPKILFPYHSLIDYDEREIFKIIYKLGWSKPADTDPCSTNCLLNTVSNYACRKQLGYHPYIGEMSLLIRESKMTYQEAINAEKIDEDSFAMKYSLKNLRLKKDDIAP